MVFMFCSEREHSWYCQYDDAVAASGAGDDDDDDDIDDDDHMKVKETTAVIAEQQSFLGQHGHSSTILKNTPQ